LSSDGLNPISYAIMALIGEGGAGAHDLARMFGQGSPIFLTATPSYAYAEPKRLEKLGYVRSHKAPGRTRERTVYELTDEGRAALHEHLAGPAPFPRIQNEASLRLLAGDMLADEEIVASLGALRPEIERVRALVDEMDANAGNVPHRARYLRLQNSLARRLLDALEQWLDEVDAELG
jgi:PadR family transcriptional regulator, regulatory protein AphA